MSSPAEREALVIKGTQWCSLASRNSVNRVKKEERQVRRRLTKVFGDPPEGQDHVTNEDQSWRTLSDSRVKSDHICKQFVYFQPRKMTVCSEYSLSTVGRWGYFWNHVTEVERIINTSFYFYRTGWFSPGTRVFFSPFNLRSIQLLFFLFGGDHNLDSNKSVVFLAWETTSYPQRKAQHLCEQHREQTSGTARG